MSVTSAYIECATGNGYHRIELIDSFLLKYRYWTFTKITASGVAKLGHTGARALATGGCAPPVQVLLKIIGAECTVINRKLGAKSAQRR